MRGKALLIFGFGVGYVLGAKAGRERYLLIKKAAAKVWNSPNIQRQAERAEVFARDIAPEVTEFLSDRAKRVFLTLAGKGKAARTAAAKTEAAKTAAAKTAAAKNAGAKTAAAKTAAAKTAAAKSAAAKRAAAADSSRAAE